MRVNFFAMAREMVGVSSLELSVAEGLTVRQLLERLAERYPPLRQNWLDAHGRLHADVPLFVNGRNPRLLPQGLETPLASDDVLSVFSPVASGRLNVEVLRQLSE
jgi:MoaD family protein